METILWLLSWIYINFPLCHLNKARIPVGIKIFATPSFYDHEKSRREVAPQHFHFQSKSASHAEVTPLCFYFRIHFPFSHYRRGQRLRHMLFLLHIRHPTRATCEWNSTALAPFSPSLLDALWCGSQWRNIFRTRESVLSVNHDRLSNRASIDENARSLYVW